MKKVGTGQLLHYPTLKSVLMVEEALKNAEEPISRTGLKKKMPKKMMHQTLNIILEYLEDRGLILDGRKGILWTYNPSLKLQRAINEGMEV